MNTDRVPCLINRVAASYASVDTCKLGKRGGVIQSMTAFLLFFFFFFGKPPPVPAGTVSR